MIRIDSIRPAAALADVVESHTRYSGTGKREQFQRVFPGSAVELTLNLSDGEVRCYDPADFEERRAHGPLLSGLFSRYYIIDTAQLNDMISVRLRPGGAWRLFGVPLDALSHQHVAMRDLSERRWNELIHRLAETNDPAGRIRRLETFLLTLDRRALHPAVEYTLATLRKPGVFPRALDLVEATGLSFRRFNELFLREVGFTLKAFMRLLRFERVAAHARNSRALSWSQTALEFGFSDQAHLIREFRTFAGYTPAQFLQASTGASS